MPNDPAYSAGHVRDQVTKQIVGEHDVEVQRAGSDRVQRVVHQEMGQLDIRILVTANTADAIAPQLTALRDIGLVQRGHNAAAFTRGRERTPRNTLYLVRPILAHLRTTLRTCSVNWRSDEEFLDIDRAGQHFARWLLGHERGPPVQHPLIVEDQPLARLQIEGQPKVVVVQPASVGALRILQKR